MCGPAYFFMPFALFYTFCANIALLQIHSDLKYCIVKFRVQILRQLGLHLKLKYCTSYIEGVKIFVKAIRVLNLNHLLLQGLCIVHNK